jgi:hypothetical protein
MLKKAIFQLFVDYLDGINVGNSEVQVAKPKNIRRTLDWDIIWIGTLVPSKHFKIETS